MEQKRVFLIVLDSAGIGAMPDAADFGDVGSNTFGALAATGRLSVPHMRKLGLFNIEGVAFGSRAGHPEGCFARMSERSKGKDTTVGHWEIAGVSSPAPLPTYPEGFPPEVMAEFVRHTGRQALCNKPYSGTRVLLDYGRLHEENGALIVYTSADSVFQVAAHEGIVPVEELYRCCEIARGILQGEHGVGRVIARPFTGQHPNYTRTPNRRDFSLEPPRPTMCDCLKDAGYDVIGVGKIRDIFAGRGITEAIHTDNNADGMEKADAFLEKPFNGLCFINLVDFDMLYGHRNHVMGYTDAMNAFDCWLGRFMPKLGKGDWLLITADHGCDPSTPSTDHSREYTPLLIYGESVRQGVDLGTRPTFADIGATVLDIFGIRGKTEGESLLNRIALQ